jgi:hypothetical protein
MTFQTIPIIHCQGSVNNEQKTIRKETVVSAVEGGSRNKLPAPGNPEKFFHQVCHPLLASLTVVAQWS